MVETITLEFFQAGLQFAQAGIVVAVLFFMEPVEIVGQLEAADKRCLGLRIKRFGSAVDALLQIFAGQLPTIDSVLARRSLGVVRGVGFKTDRARIRVTKPIDFVARQRRYLQ